LILTNEIPVDASPEAVFALLNDVERIVTCLPGAVLEGSEPDNTYLGRVKVKVGPITAGYSGKVRFVDIDHEKRQMKMRARGADTKGSGDAEAEVLLSVDAAPNGAVLRMHTDLLIRGKIAQFGKGAIVAVSNKILKQFATNLVGLLDDHAEAPAQAGAAVERTAAPAVTQSTPANVHRPQRQAPVAAQELDGLSMLFGPAALRYASMAALFALGLFQGWLLGRISAQTKSLEAYGAGRCEQARR
jgi:carbon monoxide dehydrogenase subunit G